MGVTGEMFSYPEGAVGDVDFTPGDDEGVFDGFCRDVNTEVAAVSIICDLDVDGETICILNKHISLIFSCLLGS